MMRDRLAPVGLTILVPFLRDRTFALMGYELIEGEIGDKSVHEVRRIDFAPRNR